MSVMSNVMHSLINSLIIASASHGRFIMGLIPLLVNTIREFVSLQQLFQIEMLLFLRDLARPSMPLLTKAPRVLRADARQDERQWRQRLRRRL